QAIHSITRLPSRTLDRTWGSMPRANCRAKIIAAPGRSCSRWMSAYKRLSIRCGKTRDNCAPNQKCLRLRRASPHHCALESIWYGPQPEYRLSSLCAQRSCTPLPSKRKRTECPLGAQATSLCSVLQYFSRTLRGPPQPPQGRLRFTPLTTAAIISSRRRDDG